MSINFKTKERSPAFALDCLYVQRGFPGIGRYTYNLAAALAQLEEPFRLNLIYNPALPDERHDVPALAREHPEKLRLVETDARPFSPAEQWKLPYLAGREKISVWHAPYYVRPYLLPCPSVLTSHDLISKRLPQTLSSRKARLAFEITTRLSLLVSRRIITLSCSAKRDLQALYGVPERKIKVIPHGVEEKFRPLNRAEQEQARLQLSLPECYILYVGINKPHKNLGRLLQAFAIYKERNPDTEVRLLLAGREDPRYREELHRQTNELGLAGYARWLGDIPESDLPTLYACAALFVLPSLYEGFGLPVLEAQASGVPVLVAGNTSLPEVAGGHAPTFDPYDAGELAAKIEQILQDESLLSRQRDLGLSNARRYTWRNTAEKTLEVYREALTRY